MKKDLEAKLCDRCGYDEAVKGLQIPDMFTSYYDSICENCSEELHIKAAKMID